MKTFSTLLAIAATLSIGHRAFAQNIPSETIGDTGSVSFTVQGNSFTYAVVRAGDGNVWLQQNMGSSHVADSAADPAAFGDLYQWGRWTDGHQLRTSTTAQASTLLQNNPMGLNGGSPNFYIGTNPADWWSMGTQFDSWSSYPLNIENGTDPCAAIGIGWEAPIKTEWMTVMVLESISNTATAFSSNLKLTAAGSRDGQTGTLINEGTYGNYWSATPSGAYAKDLTIGDSFANADDDAYRSYGMCVRCLNRSLHVGIGEQHRDDGIALFPNPSNGTFTITADAALLKTVMIYGSDMRLVRTVSVGMSSCTLSLEDVPNGLYWLRVEGTDRIAWKKVVISH